MYYAIILKALAPKYAGLHRVLTCKIPFIRECPSVYGDVNVNRGRDKSKAGYSGGEDIRRFLLGPSTWLVDQ